MPNSSLTYTVEAMTYGNDLTDADDWHNSGWMLVSRDTENPEDSACNRVLAIEVMKYGERDVPPPSLVQEAERLTAEAASDDVEDVAEEEPAYFKTPADQQAWRDAHRR